MHDDYTIDWICALPLEVAASVMLDKSQTYLNIAQTIRLYNIKLAEVKEQIKSYLSSEHAGKWLLIF